MTDLRIDQYSQTKTFCKIKLHQLSHSDYLYIIVTKMFLSNAKEKIVRKRFIRGFFFYKNSRRTELRASGKFKLAKLAQSEVLRFQMAAALSMSLVIIKAFKIS